MALIKMEFGKLESGFFLLNDGGENKLFFAYLHGRWSFPFPVCDGKIQGKSMHGYEAICPKQIIEVIPREDWDKFSLNDQMIREFAG
ncbi:MAG: hypothetical protein WCV70_00350 [Patescibacteria group bacterium]|jgi:hypothetical protein